MSWKRIICWMVGHRVINGGYNSWCLRCLKELCIHELSTTTKETPEIGKYSIRVEERGYCMKCGFSHKITYGDLRIPKDMLLVMGEVEHELKMTHFTSGYLHEERARIACLLEGKPESEWGDVVYEHLKDSKWVK